MPDRPRLHQQADAFREVVSQWQLAARTAVKRASSLPSSMFDACDPMLEARLAESVEKMMNCLHRPNATSVDTSQTLEIRTEQISQQELQQLSVMVGARGAGAPADGSGAPDLGAGSEAEYLTLLLDTCVEGEEAARVTAGQLLQRDFGIEPSTDLEAVAANLRQRVLELRPEASTPADDDRELAAVCLRIAASVITATSERAPQEDA